MTPQQFIQIQRHQNSIISAAHNTVEIARESVDKSPPKDELRRAKADDIREGAVVWHENGDDGWFWNVVVEPRHYGDPFKAYVADDGSRYGLDGAWVYKQAASEP